MLSLLSARLLADYRARGLWRDETIYDVAAAHAARTPGRYAIRDRYRRLTWRELVGAADAFAGVLERRGLRAGQRLVLWMPDRIESVVALLASSRLGLVSCPSPHRNHTVAEVAQMVERLRAAAFIYQTGFGADAARAGIAAALDGLGFPAHVWAVEPLGPDSGKGALAGTLGEEAAGVMPRRSPADNPDRVTYIAFTSGSTGQPKGVMHSDNTLLVTARNLPRDWALGPDSIVCSMSPFSHNLGIGALLTSIVAGAELVIHDVPRGASKVDRLIETGTTYLVGVPTHAIDLIEEVRRRGMDRLGSVRAFRVSGAASPPQVMHDLITLGVEPQSGYGMTENNSHQYTRPGDDRALIAGTCGRATDGYEIRIFDPADPDRELPVGEIGLVAGRGACLMLGYFNDQLATEAAFNADGWFLTGDLGQLDAQGYLRLTGRKKEVIIRGGHNINPARIEEIAAGVAGLARAAAISVPDPRLGERICLAFEPVPGAEVTAAEITRHLAAAGLSRYELPEFVLRMARLPLMANGKIDKPLISAWVREGREMPVPVEASPPR